ncbi:irregular chiasm C-roughest protein-like isoform X2 [Tachypleus tridentatus]|uniref:irregular chiasm C-roughest protein-like isoform X2 n=1 Tax=Tachypleus tridentatus TaxID=6853 RepID=UPI003FD19BC0
MRNLLGFVVISAVLEFSSEVASKQIGKGLKKTVQAGATVSLPCELETPGGSVQWLQNGQPVVLEAITANRRFWNVTRNGIVVLTIQDVATTDEGLWGCGRVRNDGSVGSKVEIMELTVLNPPVEPYIQLEDKRLPQGAVVTLQEWQLLLIKCVAENSSIPVRRIQWFLETTNVSSSGELFTEYLPGNKTYRSWSLLSLNITRAFNKKELVSFVFHEAWIQPVTASVSLNVLYGPTFSISREPGFGIPIVESMAVSLKCDVEANPLSDPLWQKDQSPLPFDVSSGGYLNFTSISRKDAGWYKCTTKHLFGFFTSFGYFLNVRYGAEIIKEPPKRVQAERGSSLDLECQADGKPVPSYCWARVRDAGRMEGVGSGKNLRLDRVHYEDAGHYKCIASNSVGYKQTRDIQVDVKGRPEAMPLNKTLLAIAGRSALLFVHYCSNPRPYRAHWIVRHLAISPGEKRLRYNAHNVTLLETPNCFQAALKISNVFPEDGGEILFFVKNKKGIDDAVILLNITQASLSISVGSTTIWRDQDDVLLFIISLITVAWAESFSCFLVS